MGGHDGPEYAHGIVQRFFSEGDFSEFLIEMLGVDYPSLVSNKGASVKPYISTLLPLFFTDQDDGYSGVYSAPHSFIKDQFQEMVRLVFRLPPKNFFDLKKERIDIKAQLEYLDAEVKRKEGEVDAAQKMVDAIGRPSEEIVAEIGSLESELESITRKSSTKSDSIRAFDNIISQQLSHIKNFELDLSEIKRRRRSITTMVDEINSEANALSLNETSRQIFLSFEDICSNPNCGLFSSSSNSYAKNLLYLKDQIKDLVRSDALYSRDEGKLQTQIDLYKESVQSLLKERDEQENSSEISALVASVSTLKDRIFELQLQLSEYKRLADIERSYVSSINKRNAALEMYESSRSSRSNTSDLVRVRADLRRYFLSWLDRLHTPANVSRNISFRNEFEPVMGDEKISQLSGSTKVRVVLAFHAALIEALVKEGSPIKVLVLDTPKQHEINNADLDRYFTELKRVCEDGEAQVVFSTTEYKYAGDGFDTTWEPRYDGEEQKMFLKNFEHDDA